MAPGTKKSYQRAWRTLQQFYERFYESPTPQLPLSSSHLVLFIAYLSAKKLAPSTITSYLSAIGYVHKIKGCTDPTKSFLIHKLLTALSRRRLADLRLPITRPVLHELIRSLRHTNSSAYQRCLYSAMFLLAFYGFFRIGELAAKGADRAASVLRLQNLKFLMQHGQPQMIKIIITTFKHNTDRKPFEILIEREDTLPYCPVQALIEYCKLRGALPGPLFCQPNLVPLSQFTNLTPNSPGVYSFVASIHVDIKDTVSELAPLHLRLIRDFLTPKFALLAAGNLMRLNYTFALNASR